MQPAPLRPRHCRHKAIANGRAGTWVEISTSPLAYWDHPVDSFQPESMMEHLYCQHISQDDENLVSGRNLPCLEQIAGLGVLHGNGGRGQRSL